MGGALVHAWNVLDASRRGVRDDDTWYLMHLPMQAGFALAVPVAAAVAVLALANGGWLVDRDRAACGMRDLVRRGFGDEPGSCGQSGPTIRRISGWMGSRGRRYAVDDWGLGLTCRG
jgi:hypothetical protein